MLAIPSSQTWAPVTRVSSLSEIHWAAHCLSYLSESGRGKGSRKETRTDRACHAKGLNCGFNENAKAMEFNLSGLLGGKGRGTTNRNLLIVSPRDMVVSG